MTTLQEDAELSIAKDVSGFLQSYAKKYHAGAFATPTAKELHAKPNFREYRDGDHRTVLVCKTNSRETQRTDFTGQKFPLPKGAKIITHIARTPGAPVPDLTAADFVFAYAEDHELSAGLTEQGFLPRRSRVTAAAEVITCWARTRYAPYPVHDIATITRVFLPVPAELREEIAAELEQLDGWDDDFPYYSDGSWSALSLRGFWPDDPTRGVKPAEMPKTWKEENPEALALTCEWTNLVSKVPTIAEWVMSVPWWSKLERVRLLRMDGRDGKGGKLGRHTDITDRDGGTRDGQIVRFHTPLITHPDIKLHAWTLEGKHVEHHLEQFQTYYLDARKPHAVINPTGVTRIHLVADVVSSPEVRSQITHAHTNGGALA